MLLMCNYDYKVLAVLDFTVLTIIIVHANGISCLLLQSDFYDDCTLYDYTYII